jgi:phage-related protein
VRRRISVGQAVEGVRGTQRLGDVFFRSDAFRAVYTVRFAEVIYVLHAFQKKSTRGVETPKRELDLIRRRLAAVEQHHEERRRRHGEEASHHQG